MSGTANGVARATSGVDGLDLLAHGGLPLGRTTLVAGTAGSGKTVLCGQFLAAGVEVGEAGVFVTFEERPEDIRQNLSSFGWDIPSWERSGHLAFVDASPRYDVDISYVGEYDLTPLIARVQEAVSRVAAKRVAIDSIGALMTQFEVIGPARRALYKLVSAMTDMGVTAIVTAERPEEYGSIGRLGFEEFVADGVVVLRNALQAEKRRRTLEVLKLRGGAHERGEHLFTLVAGKGIVIVPANDVAVANNASSQRLTTGNERLDGMLGGGLFECSLTLVAGPTGAGKSLLGLQFVGGGAASGQRSLLLSFEEGRAQLVRNARAIGIDLEAMEQAGTLRISAATPESSAVEDHLERMKELIADFGPERVAIDSLSALQRVSTVVGFSEYVLGIAAQIKRAGATGLVTSAASHFRGRRMDDDLQVSTISDTILLLSYVPVTKELRKGVQILKMRGSDHDKAVRELTITSSGLVVGDVIDGMTAQG